MSTWPNRGVPPAAWQGPEDKKQQPKTNSPNRLTHRNTDSPGHIFERRSIAKTRQYIRFSSTTDRYFSSVAQLTDGNFPTSS